jgi:hypothetical protein
VLPAITAAKSTVVLLGQSLRDTNSERSIQEQLSDENNQINVFAFDLDPIVGDDEQEALRYATAHQAQLEVPIRIPSLVSTSEGSRILCCVRS